MKQFLLTMGGVLAGLMLFFIGLPLILIIMASGAPKAATGDSVLQLDLRQALTDQEAQNPFAAFGGQRLSVMGVVHTLQHAETDSKIKALIVRLPEMGMAPAAADEIRQAIKRFRAKGKPVFAHSQGFLPIGSAASSYEVGAAADQLWMQPDSFFQVAGYANDEIFFKRFFDKHQVRANFEQREGYKNAVNPYLHDDYTLEHKASTLSWMTSVYQSSLLTAARDRGRDASLIREAVESSPLSANETVAKGLADRVGQVAELEAAAKARAGHGAKLVDFADYQASTRINRPARGDAIAVIDGEGPIVTGSAENNSVWGGDQTIYSDDLSEAIYKAINDKDVRAIVLRISSPGGSPAASEQILAAVRAAKAAGKPVVTSMGTYAASGGYWIASESSAIVAQPTTLTGSIGVYGGKFALGEALSRFGIDMRQTQIGGEFASTYSPSSEWSPAQRAGVAKTMDVIYADFITRVARGRKLKPERVREIAQGRVWTGLQARGLGLVDELGGFPVAVDRAKALAGIKGDVRLKRMTQEPTAFEAFSRALGVSAESAKVMAAAGWVLGDPRAKAMMDQLMVARMHSRGPQALAPLPLR